jgi:hypothetical protein
MAIEVIRFLSHYLTRDSVDFSQVNFLVLGLPFYWFAFDITIKYLKKLSFISEKKMVCPISSDCLIIFDKNSHNHLKEMFNNNEAIFLGKQTLVYRNHHLKDLLSNDFIESIIIKGNESFDLLAFKVFSDNENTKVEIKMNQENNSLFILPNYYKSKSFIKIEFEYHANSQLNFETKINLVDGDKIDEKLDWRYKNYEQYASFSILYGNISMFLPIIAFIPSSVFYFMIVFSFKVILPVTTNLIYNPLFITIYVTIFTYIFKKLRFWEKQNLSQFKIEKWHEVSFDSEFINLSK